MLATSDPYPSPHAKPEANVEYGNVQRFPVEIDDGYRAQDQRKNRNSYRPLFITLYVMLLLATAGLAFAVTRYVQTVKNKHKSPPSQDTTSDGSTDVDSSSPATLAEVDPDRDLIAYRSDIEYILFTEMDEGLSTDFVEGPQKRAIDWLVSDDLVLNSTEVRAMAEYIKNGDEDSVSTVPLVQRYALMVLFFATNGELWSDSSWRELVNVPECRFMGIECDLEGHINTLDVGYRKLRGRLPGEVGMLSMLTSLNVESNNLEGTIPSFLYNKLTKLERVDMRNNGFLSTISSDISKLTNLKALYLGELFLTGEVPADAMKSLSSLEEISISHATEMTGPLLEFSEHWPNLTYFDILRSTFTGTIPTTIGTNTNLKYIWLEQTSMNTSILPTELGLLPNLKEFILDNLVVDDTTGTIPTELGNCQALTSLHVDKFRGPIPTELGRLTNLKFLSMTEGGLTGSVPSELGLLTNLNEMYLYNNRLESSLPSALGNVQGLKILDISMNNLTGSIPEGICRSPSIGIKRDCFIDKCDCCSLYCIEG